jgi:uncharacterized membrane protein
MEESDGFVYGEVDPPQGPDTAPSQEPDAREDRRRLLNRELMVQARVALTGNWGSAVLGYVLCVVLIVSLYLFVFSSAFFVGAVGGLSGANTEVATEAMQGIIQLAEFLFSGAFMVGFARFFLVIVQERQVRLECLFAGFKRFWTAFGAYFFSNLFVALWSMLLIVPGIIAIFRYAMTFFVLADDPTCGPLEAITRSKEMMVGNKWKFFCLHWRFFWWWLLCLIIPIGFLWLVPYMKTTFARFYEDVK